MAKKRRDRRPGAAISARPVSAPRGRVTPRGSSDSPRYTPPTPREVYVSPRWVPITMGVLLVLGVLVIITNYLGVLPGGASNYYLLAGLGLITGGFIVATRWR